MIIHSSNIVFISYVKKLHIFTIFFFVFYIDLSLNTKFSNPHLSPLCLTPSYRILGAKAKTKHLGYWKKVKGFGECARDYTFPDDTGATMSIQVSYVYIVTYDHHISFLLIILPFSSPLYTLSITLHHSRFPPSLSQQYFEKRYSSFLKGGMKFPSLPTINFGSVGKPDLIPAELGTYLRSFINHYFYPLLSIFLEL